MLKHALLAAATTALFAAFSPAALILQSGQSSYALTPNGSTVTTVSVYLTQTTPTTVVTDNGGLNSFQIKLTPTGTTNLPTLSAVHVNPAFTGNSVQNAATATLGGSFMNFSSGVTVDSGGKILLGTFDFTAAAGTVGTSYSITTPTAGYDYTANTATPNGVDLGSQITAGSFAVTVPEPTTLALFGVAACLGLRRRTSHSA